MEYNCQRRVFMKDSLADVAVMDTCTVVLMGKVRSEEGNEVSDVSITLLPKLKWMNKAITVMPDENGSYAFRHVSGGTYDVIIEAEGACKRSIIKNVVLHPSYGVRLNIVEKSVTKSSRH